MKTLLALALASAAAFATAGSAGVQEPTASPRLLVHLLDYVGKDYAGAVRDGRVIDPNEYREQVEFAQAALALSQELPETRGQTEITSAIATLAVLIASKASPDDVSNLAQETSKEVIRVAHLSRAPDRWPSLARGGALYRSDCAGCHGERGAGDGPAAKALDPRPADFTSEEVGFDMSPFRAFNAIRVGVPRTAMAAWPELSDQDVWDLAFYVTSLHVGTSPSGRTPPPDGLVLAATQSDRQLMASLRGSEQAKREEIAALRLHEAVDAGETRASGAGPANTLALARSYLAQAGAAYTAGDFDGARNAALLAYLEGIEPVEPRLRANDPRFVADLEASMMAVRSAVDARASGLDLQACLAAAGRLISEADRRLQEEPSGPWVAFALAAGILLREGFEAVLILVALLAVVRASNARTAALWIHAGWGAALAVGLASWFFSGWLVAFSGARREMLEAWTALLAVAVLLYIGFWLHRRTEISRWQQFLDQQVHAALRGGNLFGLAAISFMAVFREAFETVLFLRAVTLEAGAAQSAALAGGAALAFALIVALSWALLRYSANVPIRRIFSISSVLMGLLAVILTGKGMHALQETGTIPATPTCWSWSWDLLGVYATWEPIASQLVIVALVGLLWIVGSRPSARRA